MATATALAGQASAGQLTVHALDKSYGDPPRRKRVVAGCSFTLARGELVAMIGPSGCGKSSLVRLLAGFDRPDAGHIELDGHAIDAPGRERLVLFQEAALFPWMTTFDNLLYGPQARGELTDQTRAYADLLLERVGLRAFAHKYPAQLSGGMQRRAELARALINQPKVMLLDEPFRGLDAVSAERLESLLGRLAGEGRTLLIATHEVAQARRWERVLCLNGRQIAFGRADEVLSAEVLEETYGETLVTVPGLPGHAVVPPHHHH
jgi:NitT/TauT family transport system ATP-binding protein